MAIEIQYGNTRYPVRKPSKAESIRRLLAYFAFAALAYASVPAAQACGDGGATCSGGAEPATQASGAGNVGAGNPINVITGNKYQREVDMPALPGVLGLEIVRHYNSALSGPQTRPGALGRGWRLSYESSLRLTPTGAQVDQADGSIMMFGRDLANKAVLLPRDPSQGNIEIIKTGRGDEYLWTWADGRKLRFNVLGQLEQIQAPTGEVLSMQYDKRGFLLRVTDPQGRSLRLAWLDKETAKLGDRFRGVQTIDSPLGRFSYGYGSETPKGATIAPKMLLANLVKVTYPVAGEGRRYHYESAQHPTRMTGISIDGTDAKGKPTSIRYATFGYRSDGRANLSTHANDVDKVTVEYPSADTTTVTNSLGQKTVYRFRSFYSEDRLLEVRGAGCSLCGEPNVRYGYDSLGRLTSTTKLAGDGTPQQATLTELDHYGRPRKVSQVAYANGKAQAPQWTQRYEYAPGSAQLPTLIARPSVVPGQEYVTKITYARLRDAVSVPVKISERGFAPTVDGKGVAYPIERTVAHRFNAYGQRIETDGPLANAAQATPANSDLTVTEYDPKTKLATKTTAPGGVVTQVLERDEALRPTRVSVSDGRTVETTAVRYNLRGQPEQIDIDAVLVRNGAPDAATRQARTIRYRYDLMGNLASITLPGNVTTSFVYDAAGRLTQRINPDGTRVATVQDSEGRLVSEGRYLDADTTPAKAQNVVRMAADGTAASASGGAIERDELMRPVAWRAADGAVVAKAAWGAPGTAAQASVLAIDVGAARADRMVDDFGQVVAIRNPGQGWQLARHDAAGRIIQSVDPRGARQVAEWDAAGRLRKLTRYAPGAAQAEQTLNYRYAGTLPVEQTIADADGTRQTVSAFDAAGRIVSQVLHVNPAGEAARALAAPVRMARGWRYDASGALVALTFTDNTGTAFELQQQADAQGRARRISTRGVLPDALGGGRAIAAIDWQHGVDEAFAQRIVHGDGTADQYDALPGPSPADEPAAGAPRIQSASFQQAPAAALRRSPGRDPDAAGLPSAITTGLADARLEWNAAGQLARSVRADGSTRYLYDANGQRVARIVTDAQGSATATLFFYHDNHLVAEADAGGRAQYAYAYLGWRPLAQVDLRRQSWTDDLKRWLFGAPVRHLHTDRVGRVTSMTDAGQAVWNDDASPTPQVLRAARKLSGGVHQPLRYVSQYHDEDTGLAYHGARYFDAGSGRFLTPDPAGIADALNGVPRELLLDLYAYAGGRPDDYFDPDGAARIRYFAITTNASGQQFPAAPGQGYTRARWAFIIDNVKAGGDNSALGQKQNEYAQKGTSLLVDVKGDFLANGKSSATWNTGETNIGDAFTQHYGNNLVSIAEFTINNMRDSDAAAMIASYISADLQTVFQGACPNRGGLLPQIRFANGDADINVTDVNANGANKQRILNCKLNASTTFPVPYANDEERRRVEKYEAAAELNESPAPPAIYKDCSQNGCPGMSVNVNGHTYHASYGRTQFVGETFLRTLKTLIINNAEVSAADKQKLGVTPDIINRIDEGIKRSGAIGVHPSGFFSSYRAQFGTGLSAAQAGAAWDGLSAAQKQNFQTKTGLGKQEFVDMLGFQPAGAVTLGEGRNAFMTEAIFSDTVLRDWLLNKFKSNDEYNFISRMFLRSNLRTVQSTAALQSQFVNNEPANTDAWRTKQRKIEENLAARVARLHNGGLYKATPTSSNQTLAFHPDADVLTRQCQSSHLGACDSNGRYVGHFLGIVAGRGEWRSERCTDSLGSRPGLDTQELKLN